MEEEKSQPPPEQQLDQPAEKVEAAVVTPAGAGAAADDDDDAPVYDEYMDVEEEEEDAYLQSIEADTAAPIEDVHMEEQEKDVAAAAEEADRQKRVAADEEMAHHVYMQQILEMEEWQLRDVNHRPSLRAALDLPLSDFPSNYSSSSSRAGVGAANTTATRGFWSSSGTRSYALNTRDPVIQPYVPPQARARGGFESVQEAQSGAEFLGNSRIPGGLELDQAEKGKGPLEVQTGKEKEEGPLDQAEKRILEILATVPSTSNGGLGSSLARPEAERESVAAVNRGAGTNATLGFMRPGPRDFATTPARQTVTAGSAYAVPNETPAPASFVRSAGCGATARPARPYVPANNDDPVSTKRRALLAEPDSAIMFAGMEEGDNNRWYESMVVPDDDEEKPEQVELQDLNESLQQCLARSEPYNPAATVAAQGRDFSLQDFCQRWDVTPSDIEPDEAGPSTRAPKVRPLADHEVPTFDCGICMETLPVLDLFHGLPCKHRFCAPCMTTYVEGRIRAGELPIPCPDPRCGRGDDDGGRGVLHPEKCKKAIDYAAFGDWGARLTESAVPPDRRAYCPNRSCGILLETSGEAEPARALCLACGHALCATCGMEWSSDGGDGLGVHDCAKSPEAGLVRQLARDRRWQQCPSCKMLVERIDGCNHMTCRCRFVFCYRCGNPLRHGQVGAGGLVLEPCRCNDTGLAFAMGHHHQAHPNLVDQAMQLPPVEVDLNMAQPGVDLNMAPQPPMEVALNQPVWDQDPDDWLA